MIKVIKVFTIVSFFIEIYQRIKKYTSWPIPPTNSLSSAASAAASAASSCTALATTLTTAFALAASVSGYRHLYILQRFLPRLKYFNIKKHKAYMILLLSSTWGYKPRA